MYGDGVFIPLMLVGDGDLLLDNERVQIALAWEFAVGCGMLIIRGLMTATPMRYLRLRNHLPGLHPAQWPCQSSPGGPELMRRWRYWRLRTRAVGICLIGVGAMILRAANHGEVPKPDPYLFWRP
jgi:hypothetical protein